MSNGTDELRREIQRLYDQRARGDLPAKHFERRLTEKSVALSRAVVGARLAPGESILAEHHVIHSHIKLTQSLLREPEQATDSYYASNRILYRVRGTLLPGRAVTCDESDATAVDALAFEQIARIVPRHELRWGEAAVGIAIMLIAIVSRDALALTSPMLLLLGFLGTAHGLLLPTRWLDIVPECADTTAPWELHGIRRRSARKLLAILRRARPQIDPPGSR